MAHILFTRGLRNAQSKITELGQQFKYLLILDFEATCEKHGTLKPQEIIEFPCLALSTEDWKVRDVFHQYVKPRINPVLTPYCTDLTGIMQEHVDDQPCFPKILSEFDKWLDTKGFMEKDKTSAFVTCGDWDLRVMLPGQCALDQLEIPKYFDEWIDLKRIYCEATGIYPRSLKDMLIRSNLRLKGRLHSGIYDAENMSNIIIDMQNHHNTIFKITSTREEIKTTL